MLKAVKAAAEEKICIPILIGDKEKIIELSQGINFDLEGIQIIETKDEIEAARKAVSMVSSGQADIVMKGLIDTSLILKAVLDKEIGLRTGNILNLSLIHI